MLLKKVLMVLAFLCFAYYIMEKTNTGKELPSDSMFFSSMSTGGSLLFYAEKAEIRKKAMQDALSAIKEVEKTCNVFDSESELSKLNASAAKEPFQCSDMLWDIICRAKAFYTMSDGAFDVTCAPLIQLWAEAGKQNKLPTEEQLNAAKEISGFDKVTLDLKKHAVSFSKPGMSINLGGIAKGFALDQAMAAAEKAGVHSGWIDIGGNVITLPTTPPGKKDFMAAIRNPFKTTETFGKITMSHEAISTSGSYERFVTINGKRYSHILNPRTGLPVEDSVSVTVIAETGIASDALSTSIFVAGPTILDKLKLLYPKLKVLIVQGTEDDPKLLKFGDDWSGFHLEKQSAQ